MSRAMGRGGKKSGVVAGAACPASGAKRDADAAEEPQERNPKAARVEAKPSAIKIRDPLRRRHRELQGEENVAKLRQ